MALKNTLEHYGLINKSLHWLVAVTVFLLFGSGLWMVDLGYYDAWYQRAPHYHKSVGLLLCATMIFRVFWRYYNPPPRKLPSHSSIEQRIGRYVHTLLYCGLFCLFLSGYLISTADNKGIDIFTWLTVPSLGSFVENQEDISGEIHEWLAFILIGVASLHALAALKHHIIDRDNTLKRML